MTTLTAEQRAAGRVIVRLADGDYDDTRTVLQALGLAPYARRYHNLHGVTINAPAGTYEARGKHPVKVAGPGDDRCEARHYRRRDGKPRRCMMPAGHDDRHYANDKARWSDDDGSAMRPEPKRVPAPARPKVTRIDVAPADVRCESRLFSRSGKSRRCAWPAGHDDRHISSDMHRWDDQ